MELSSVSRYSIDAGLGHDVIIIGAALKEYIRPVAQSSELLGYRVSLRGVFFMAKLSFVLAALFCFVFLFCRLALPPFLFSSIFECSKNASMLTIG